MRAVCSGDSSSVTSKTRDSFSQWSNPRVVVMITAIGPSTRCVRVSIRDFPLSSVRSAVSVTISPSLIMSRSGYSARSAPTVSTMTTTLPLSDVPK
jgi:hypothetical protein